jgi:hypothetical protein
MVDSFDTNNHPPLNFSSTGLLPASAAERQSADIYLVPEHTG